MVSTSSRCWMGCICSCTGEDIRQGANSPDVHWSTSATKPSHAHVKASDSLSFVAAGINQGSWRTLCEIHIHSYIMCKGHTVSCYFTVMIQDTILKLKSLASVSLFHFISLQRNNSTEECSFVFWGCGGVGLSVKMLQLQSLRISSSLV